MIEPGMVYQHQVDEMFGEHYLQDELATFDHQSLTVGTCRVCGALVRNDSYHFPSAQQAHYAYHANRGEVES